jgi:anionic cell wall polymer biosynthesis LytR-Cps2A-Psr (LCP) family protein
LKKNFDIDIQYYALVNFNSFATVIDSLYPMGVKIDAKFSTIDGETVKSVDVPDDLNWTPEHQNPIQKLR